MLSGGQAEDKKRAVFELIDVDLNGTVEREEFLRFMVSTMRVLYETSPGTRETIGVGPEELAEIVTEDAFNRFDWNRDNRLTYEEFSAYWDADGADIPEDVTIEATRAILGVDRYHVDDLLEIVSSAADHKGWISVESFSKVMSELARHGRELTEAQEVTRFFFQTCGARAKRSNIFSSCFCVFLQAQLSRTLLRLYKSFDTDNSGSVDFQELAAGLSVLCGGHRDARAGWFFPLALKFTNRRTHINIKNSRARFFCARYSNRGRVPSVRC